MSPRADNRVYNRVANGKCHNCGNTIIDRRNQYFCGGPCFYESMKKHRDTRRTPCLNCGSQTNHSCGKSDKFCDTACMVEYKIGLRIKTCAQCGTPFIPQTNHQKCCSLKCGGMFKRVTVPRHKCKRCGVLHNKRESVRDGDSRPFCGKQCFYKWQQERFSDRWFETTCSECPKHIKVRKRRPKYTCSSRCERLRLSRIKRSPQWWASRPGVTVRSYGPEWMSVRYACLKRDYFCCQLCGQNRKTNKGLLAAHHKTPVRQFADLREAHKMNNLVTVCRIRCHQAVEMCDRWYGLTTDQYISICREVFVPH